MQVIGAGYARTGTLSLKAALEMLGFARACIRSSCRLRRRPRPPAARRAPALGASGSPTGGRARLGRRASLPRADGGLPGRDRAAERARPRRVVSQLRDAACARRASSRSRARRALEAAETRASTRSAARRAVPLERAARRERRRRASARWPLSPPQRGGRRPAVPPSGCSCGTSPKGWAPLCERLGVDAPDARLPAPQHRARLPRALRAASRAGAQARAPLLAPSPHRLARRSRPRSGASPRTRSCPPSACRR